MPVIPEKKKYLITLSTKEHRNNRRLGDSHCVRHKKYFVTAIIDSEALEERYSYQAFEKIYAALRDARGF